MSSPVLYQSRTRPKWRDERSWTDWEDCTKEQAEDCWKRPEINEWLYEARALYTSPHPSESVTWNYFVGIASALIKAADDAAADDNYMLDSDDCIKVLRGEWTDHDKEHS